MLPKCAQDTQNMTHSSFPNDYINVMVYMVTVNTETKD